MTKRKKKTGPVDEDVNVVEVCPISKKKKKKEKKTDGAVIESQQNEYRPYKVVACEKTKCKILILQPGAGLTFHGFVEFQTLFGQVHVFGSVHQSASYSDDRWILVSAPNLLSPPCTIRCPYFESNSTNLVLSRLKNRVKTVASEEAYQEVASHYTLGSSVVLLRSKLPNFARTVRSILPECFSKSQPKNNLLQHAFSIPDFVNIYPPSVYTVVDEVTQMIELRKDDGQSSVILLVGPKNSGKSTLGRCLLNLLFQNFSSIFHLEADVGQTEFTPPGCIALTEVKKPLLGPPMTHMENEFSNTYFFGDISPADRQEQYLETIDHLLAEFQNLAVEQPRCLIVNSHGWVEGPGFDLQHELLQRARPNFLIQFTSIEFRKEVFVSADIAVSTHNSTLPVLVEKTSKESLNAQKLRDASILSYFSPLLTCGDLSTILDIRPYEISWNSVGLWFAVGHSSPINSILSVLNASLVGLCYVPDNQLGGSIIDDDDTLPRMVLTEEPLQCLGYGIVRAIDIERKLFYVITPLPLETLEKVNVLAHGAVDLPNSIFYAQTTPHQMPYVIRTGNTTKAVTFIKGYKNR